MRAYVGQCRGAKLIAACTAAGLGECTQPDEFPPRRTPWFADNGAFKSWRAGRPFDPEAFGQYLARVAAAPTPPEFIVAPDLVAKGAESLALSLAWVDRCRAVAPVALVVQDGMTEQEVSAVLDRFAVLFVGGALPWKLSTAASWVRLAHAHGLTCHVGRVGTAARVAWARSLGVDSIDSCLPLFSRDQFRRFVSALTAPGVQLNLFAA